MSLRIHELICRWGIKGFPTCAGVFSRIYPRRSNMRNDFSPLYIFEICVSSLISCVQYSCTRVNARHFSCVSDQRACAMIFCNCTNSSNAPEDRFSLCGLFAEVRSKLEGNKCSSNRVDTLPRHSPLPLKTIQSIRLRKISNCSGLEHEQDVRKSESAAFDKPHGFANVLVGPIGLGISEWFSKHFLVVWVTTPVQLFSFVS